MKTEKIVYLILSLIKKEENKVSTLREKTIN